MNITEPDHGNLPTDVRICLSAQLNQPTDRLVAFEYSVADFSTAISNDYSLCFRPDLHLTSFRCFLPQVFSTDRGLFISPGSRNFQGCVTARIFGDDRPENDETLTILFEPLSTLDRVNFGPNVTINIIDNDRK